MERDAGFCSGSSENNDDYALDYSRDGQQSPTDTSEDSVEVKFTPISIPKNKRKSLEPCRVVTETNDYPLKKRIKYDEKLRVHKIESELQPTDSIQSIKDEDKSIEASHFRPWASVTKSPTIDTIMQCINPPTIPNPAEVLLRHPGVTTLHRLPNMHHNNVQEQPLALLAKKSKPFSTNTQEHKPMPIVKEFSETHIPSTSSKWPCIIDVTKPTDSITTTESLPPPIDEHCDRSINNGGGNTSSKLSQPRNYKNMTRERRIEANARERTRVHTISAAFDTLRRSIPSYSNTQKLSKLSVLRVACSYILTLSRIAGSDYSSDQSEPSIADCVEEVTKTIQTEGKIRKKKDE